MQHLDTTNPTLIKYDIHIILEAMEMGYNLLDDCVFQCIWHALKEGELEGMASLIQAHGESHKELRPMYGVLLHYLDAIEFHEEFNNDEPNV